MAEDIKELLKEQTGEIKRHNKVLQEDFKSQIKTISEQYSSLKKITDDTFNTVGEMNERLTMVEVNVKGLKEDVKDMKADLKSIKGRLREIERSISSLELYQISTKNEFKDIKGRLSNIEEELKNIRKDIKTKAEQGEIEALEKRVLILDSPPLVGYIIKDITDFKLIYGF
jgi:chromosome segregation ATPase